MATAKDFPEFNILERLMAPMPRFWSMVFKVASIVLIVCLGIIQTYTQLTELGIDFPLWVVKVMALISTVTGFLSKLTVDKERWALRQ